MTCCDHCGLVVNTTGFTIKSTEDEKFFCCEGCKSIYILFSSNELAENTTTNPRTTSHWLSNLNFLGSNNKN